MKLIDLKTEFHFKARTSKKSLQNSNFLVKSRYPTYIVVPYFATIVFSLIVNFQF